MKDTLRTLGVTILVIMIIVLILKGLFFILPYVIVIGLVFYIVSKVRGKEKTKDMNYNTYDIKKEEGNIKKEDTFDGNVIDVDYKDVEK